MMAEEFARGLDERSLTASGSFLDASDFRMHNKVTTTAYMVEVATDNRIKAKKKRCAYDGTHVCLYMHTFLKKVDK